jgi:hypothetical protein
VRRRVSRAVHHTLFLFALIAWPSEAQATPVLTSATEPDLVGDWNFVAPSSRGHEGILGYLYGWANLTRIDDEGPLSDRWWGLQSEGVVRARAMFGQNQFNFGSLDGSGFHSNLTYGGGPGYLDLHAQRPASSDPLSRFALFTIRGLFESAQAEDHMVTFQITGNADQYGRDYSRNEIGNFIVAWEDLPFAISDRDYNDFVLELSGVRIAFEPSNPVPEPASVVLFVSGLAAIWHVRRGRERDGVVDDRRGSVAVPVASGSGKSR